jgi:hypothetical protein
MYSYGHFRPGGRNNTAYIINYLTLYNELYGDKGQIKSCLCIPNKYDKNTPGSDSSSAKVSYATRIAGIIQQTKGGNTQYGNFYLGQPLNVNYLGRIQGMPGGSGAPPTNKF